MVIQYLEDFCLMKPRYRLPGLIVVHKDDLFADVFQKVTAGNNTGDPVLFIHNSHAPVVRTEEFSFCLASQHGSRNLDVPSFCCQGCGN